MKIPLLDLKAQYAGIRNEVMNAVSEVLESQVCILGPKVDELEKKVAALSDCPFAVGVSSGTDALLAALMALGIGAGDEVITTPFTFFATAGCVSRVRRQAGLRRYRPGTYNIDPARIEAADYAADQGHHAGAPVWPDVPTWTRSWISPTGTGLPVIEDAAQAIGATYKGRKPGAWARFGCFSFFPSKNLGGAGDGGMVRDQRSRAPRDAAADARARLEAEVLPQVRRRQFPPRSAAGGRAAGQAPHLDAWSAARRRNAASYDAAFAGSSIQTPFIHPDCVSIYNQYSIRVKGRDALRKAMTEAGIGTEIYYPVPMHLQECFQGKCRVVGSLQHSETAANEVLALPIYPELTGEQIQYVAQTVIEATEKQPA